MADEDVAERRFKWEEEQKAIDRKVETERLQLEREKTKWDRNVWIRAGLPVTLAVIAFGQVWLASIAQQQSERRDHEQGERANRQDTLQFAQFVYDHKKDLFSPDPELKCQAVDIASLLPAFRSSVGLLKIDANLCAREDERTAAIFRYRAEPCRQGAPEGLVRMNPATGRLFSESFAVTTENRHGRPNIVETRTQSLSARGRIYNVEYSCSGATCGWSYNPEPAKGYAPSIQISDDKKSFTWWRLWDGDPAAETYTAYYEVPLADVGVVSATACRERGQS